MKLVEYTRNALKDVKRQGNFAPRIRQVLAEYAADTQSHANNVTQLVGSSAKRLRVGDYRVIFEEDAGKIVVTKIAPRASAYE